MHIRCKFSVIAYTLWKVAIYKTKQICTQRREPVCMFQVQWRARSFVCTAQWRNDWEQEQNTLYREENRRRNFRKSTTVGKQFPKERAAKKTETLARQEVEDGAQAVG